MTEDDALRALIVVEALKNAVKFNGKANPKAVMGKVLGARADLRSKVKQVGPLVGGVVREVNAMSPDDQRKMLLELSPQSLEREKRGPEERELPPLPGVDEAGGGGNGRVVMRLAPYPSGALHVGNARMIVLNDYYVKRYGGKLILAFDDTIGSPKSKLNDPKAKFVIPEAYDLIREGLRWLKVEWHEEVYKSDRLELYYGYCRELLQRNLAYVCTCPAGEFKKKYKDAGRPCPHRDQGVDAALGQWDDLLGGKYGEMEAVVRLKTGMDQPDPAVRDQIIMRISEAEHPRVGTRYLVWPMLEFSWAVDDHELGVTHVIRGADLVKEDFIEEFVWNLFGWEMAHFLHYGRMKFPGMNLSKTEGRARIQEGTYLGWHDPRTWSLQSLEARGILPEALRETLLDMGLSMTPITVSPDALYAKNQKMIDANSPRYFYVEAPVPLRVEGAPAEVFVAEPLLFPPDEARGRRRVELKADGGVAEVFLSASDARDLEPGSGLRLKDLFNVKVTEATKNATQGPNSWSLVAEFHSKDVDRTLQFPIVQWVPASDNVSCSILLPDGRRSKGFAETSVASLGVGTTVQFERFGFARLAATGEELTWFFTH
ncbi:MAG: glutamate--tRNA ligase [Promethearchaeota archaeon]